MGSVIKLGAQPNKNYEGLWQNESSVTAPTKSLIPHSTKNVKWGLKVTIMNI